MGMLHDGHKPQIETPCLFATTSRGVVPHITPDTLSRDTSIKGAYLALEDFIERDPPPILQYSSKNEASPLRHFTGHADDTILILGARRCPPVPSPIASSPHGISVLTSVGFSNVTVNQYAGATAKLKPNIVVGLGDIPFGVSKISTKKTEKMTDRTGRWMVEQVQARNLSSEQSSEPETQSPALFAPILPLPIDAQRPYIETLEDLPKDSLSGLAIYDTDSLHNLPSSLLHLPRLGLTEPSTPAQVLQSLSLGIDIFMIPFINVATDAGIALSFTFPAPNPSSSLPSEAASTDRQPLGIDMWQPLHATDISPLTPSCKCYTCQHHHRAYIHHLLQAKEMTGWVLLQIHNHQIMDDFFADVRGSIKRNTFEADRKAFEGFYVESLPERTGMGPRVRGYQFKSEGPGEVKRNQVAYKSLEGKEEVLKGDVTDVQEDKTV